MPAIERLTITAPAEMAAIRSGDDSGPGSPGMKRLTGFVDELRHTAAHSARDLGRAFDA